jgi:ABC-type cobalamin transport system ATPase subunit
LGERLDVVWRRIAASVPTYAFEIQIGGNLHQALSKLKHAYDIWNSNIFLISTKEDLHKINQLLSGTFHEIGERIRVLSIEKINEVYELQVKDHKLKKEIGFR